MLSKDVLKNIEILYKSDNYTDMITIDHLTDNTSDIDFNSCFVCVKGNKFDSHDLIDKAAITPKLIIANREIKTNTPYVIIKNTTKSLPLICANFFKNPSSELNLIGVTGTDGKTTTSQITKQLLDRVNSCAYIGTNGFMFGEKKISTHLTTPKPIILNRFLTNINREFIKNVTIEVSSQGIDAHRVDYLNFKVAVFTNLSHEHLDYHKTIENYFLSKLKLFQMLNKESHAVINLDSEPYASRIIKSTKANLITYGTNINSMFKIANIKTSLVKTIFDLFTPEGVYKKISLNMFGDYNVFNATAAICSCYALGYKIDDLINTLDTLEEIDGRMHIIDYGQPFNVIVDFAHTPNALNCLLKNLSKLDSKIIIVFGSAGERDKSKRSIMGEVVEKYASQIILTSEDPKSEDSLEIINDILKGIKNTFKVSIIPDRKNAIVRALEKAQNGETVIITGKGNEKIEVFNGYIVEHNDIDVSEDFLNQKYHSQCTYSIANL